MSWKFLIFLFGYLLLMQPIHSAVETNTANDEELQLSEDRTQSAASLAEFSAKMYGFLRRLGTRLPTRKTDDVCMIINVGDAIFEDALEIMKVAYEDVIKLVPEADKYDTYHFITDLRIFSTELYKAKKTVENDVESPEFREFQEHQKAQLIKLLRRFTKHLIDVAERYWNSLSAEERTDAQKQFYDKIQEIKTETDVVKIYEDFYNLTLTTYQSLHLI